MWLLENFKLYKIKWLACVAWIIIIIQLFLLDSHVLYHLLSGKEKEINVSLN